MNRRFCYLIYLLCSVIILLMSVLAIYYFFAIESFSSLVIASINLPIDWSSVEIWQWYLLLFLSSVYSSIGLMGVYFLRFSFHQFSQGEYFNLKNSQNIKRFSLFLFIQAAATPLHFALVSVLLSFNHLAGQRILSLSFGSNEIKSIFIAMILWVLATLLVEAAKLQTENRQFI
ncbi:MAG: hypothetical protein OFPI_25230 [Osedax symbiont Rs2]|nr:MAG: hypothetical protein OFPI_25230 [Osedax symbiont Rs2]